MCCSFMDYSGCSCSELKHITSINKKVKQGIRFKCMNTSDGFALHCFALFCIWLLHLLLHDSYCYGQARLGVLLLPRSPKVAAGPKASRSWAGAPCHAPTTIPHTPYHHGSPSFPVALHLHRHILHLHHQLRHMYEENMINDF